MNTENTNTSITFNSVETSNAEKMEYKGVFGLTDEETAKTVITSSETESE